MAIDTCDALCLDLVEGERLRAARIDPALAKLAAARGRALGDPTRVVVAAALLDGTELCVCDLAWVVERSDKLVSHHLGVLRSADLVTSRREGKVVFYSLTSLGSTLLAEQLDRAARA